MSFSFSPLFGTHRNFQPDLSRAYTRFRGRATLRNLEPVYSTNLLSLSLFSFSLALALWLAFYLCLAPGRIYVLRVPVFVFLLTISLSRVCCLSLSIYLFYFGVYPPAKRTIGLVA